MFWCSPSSFDGMIPTVVTLLEGSGTPGGVSFDNDYDTSYPGEQCLALVTKLGQHAIIAPICYDC